MEQHLDILIYVFAVLGQIVHILKKHQEGDESLVPVFKKWILGKPINTLMSVFAAVLAADTLVVDGSTAVQALGTAFTAGMAANSALNRG